MVKWILREKSKDAEGKELNTHPIVAEILRSRGIIKKDEIEKFILPNYERDMHDPFLFADMQKAVERINIATEKKETVAIFGDYDADGVTSSAILRETFDNLGLSSIVYIPDKKSDTRFPGRSGN